MSIDYTKRRGSTSPAPSQAGAGAGGPVSLTKRGQTVSLSKEQSGGGPLRVNLNWNQAPVEGRGFLGKLAARGIDLDLGCLFELADGRKGVVQALGNTFGSLTEAPWVQLDKDDRSGSATDGENLLVAGAHSGDIARLAIFAFIYEGAPNWSHADAKVTIAPQHGAPIVIALDEIRNDRRMCAVCLVTGSPSGFTIEREVRYVQDHWELDEHYGWGLHWTAGRK